MLLVFSFLYGSDSVVEVILGFLYGFQSLAGCSGSYWGFQGVYKYKNT